MGDLRQPNVAAAEERPELPPPSPSSYPSPFLIGAERWDRAEEATQKIICKVQPTCVSERRRKEVIDYVQRLIRGCLGCEVFPFGSVPLKTYLPDGDIDLTAFGGATVEEALVNDVVSVLEAEDKNRASEFIVKDVQLIRAEVKLVKCIVQNIVVDISFNQLGGLCTLCFLEQVDHLIGKDHLFKRSIILIKAWCYYESRILGAHHGLISTYALETLVLYIFHLFHSTLNGPLTVLYRFLDYFSKFDWDNYCVSLTGPVRISLLPEIVAEKPENGGSDLLLSDDFLRHCAGMFSVPSRGGDSSNLRTFPSKHLNIIDPLKENNNLGRSVSKGNFYRIRSAFTYGARKLGQILQQPKDDIADDLQNFFLNTLDRHGCEQRPDVQDPIPKLVRSGHFPALSSSEPVSLETETSVLISTNFVHVNGTSNNLESNGSSCDGGNDLVVSRSEILNDRAMNRRENGSSDEVDNSCLLLETVDSLNKSAGIRYHSSGDAEDLANSRLEGLTSHETPNGLHSSPDEASMPHSGLIVDRLSSGCLQGCGDGNSMDSVASVSNQVSCLTEEGNRRYREGTFMDVSSSHHDNQKPLSNLDGDYESHLNSLRYGRWWYDNSSHLFFPPQFPSQFQGNNSWDVINHHNHYNRNGFSYANANGPPMPRPTFFHMNPLVMPGAAAFSMEDVSKARGTGPYFPNTNRYSHHNKGFTGRGRNQQGAVRSHRDNGRAELNFHDRSNHELSQAQNLHNGMLQPHHANGFLPPPEGVVEFGSGGHPIPAGVSLPDSITPLSPSQTSSHGFPSPGTRKPKPAQSMNQERVMAKSSSYLLKDDEDFPPLSV